MGAPILFSCSRQRDGLRAIVGAVVDVHRRRPSACRPRGEGDGDRAGGRRRQLRWQDARPCQSHPREGVRRFVVHAALPASTCLTAHGRDNVMGRINQDVTPCGRELAQNDQKPNRDDEAI